MNTCHGQRLPAFLVSDLEEAQSLVLIVKFGRGTHGHPHFVETELAAHGPIFREKQRGVNSVEGKTYHKTPSQKRFWTPHL